MSFKRLAVVLLFAAVLAVIIRIFFFETIRITTPAMSESQAIGNRLIVEKFTVGARFPLSIGVPFAPDLFLGKKTY
ncbi:MAG TPA: S26 family signal peptidase, partial [Bacteroidales bacterium]